MCCCEIVHDAIIGLEDVMVGYLFGKKRATEVAHSYVFASSANYFFVHFYMCWHGCMFSIVFRPSFFSGLSFSMQWSLLSCMIIRLKPMP